MKFNWGFGIVLFLIVFVSSMLFMVFLSARNTENLVSSNYYDQEIHYQDNINQMKNAADLKEEIMLYYAEPSVMMILPASFKDKNFDGTLRFFRPDGSSPDFELPIHSGRLQWEIKDPRLSHGRWKATLLLNDGAQKYRVEKDLDIH